MIKLETKGDNRHGGKQYHKVILEYPNKLESLKEMDTFLNMYHLSSKSRTDTQYKEVIIPNELEAVIGLLTKKPKDRWINVKFYQTFKVE